MKVCCYALRRVLGSREFALYYRQSHKAADTRQSVTVNTVLAKCVHPDIAHSLCQDAGYSPLLTLLLFTAMALKVLVWQLFVQSLETADVSTSTQLSSSAMRRDPLHVELVARLTLHDSQAAIFSKLV